MHHNRDTDERLMRPALANPEEAAAGPAQPGPSMAALARQSPEVRAAVLRRLSRSAGNRAVVARIEDMAIAGPEIVRGWREESDSKLKIDVDSATEPEKLAEIERLLGDASEPGRGDADTTGWAISKVWKSFGEDMWEKALANRPLFERSMGRARDLVWWEDGWGGMRDRFRLAVETRVRDNLAANRAYVRDEMIALGIGEQLEGEEHLQPERDRALRETQVKAEMVVRAEEGMAKARAMKVGETTEWIVTGAGIPMQVTLPEYFDPEEQPDGPGQGQGSQDWAAIKKEYDKLDRIVKQAVAESPALFALHELSKQDMGGFAGLDAEQARAKLRPMLQAVVGKIDEAEGLVGDDLDYREMGPVHQQLAGTPGWSGQIEREFIRATVTDYNTDKLLRSLGLSLISAIGFLFATFATGGAAVFIGVAAGIGASAVQAGLSIEDYYDKAKARAARTGNPELDIMSEEAVDSAFTQAVLDTALAGLDALGGVGAIRKLASPAVKLLRAGEAGLKASAEVTIKEALHAGDAVSQGAAIERAVAELGVEGTVRATGKAPAELAALLPPDSAVAKRLLAGADALKAGATETEPLFARLRDLGSLDADAAASAVNEGFERVGFIGTLEAAGGWNAVNKRFGEGHEIVTKLEAWRSQVVQESLDYVKAASKEQSIAVRTGTESGMSDVDISTFGRDAAQNVERIKEFLARRTNVTRDRLEFLLDADAAVNPTRMHLQDIAPKLSAEMHEKILVESTKHQEQLIFARRWHDAREAGDLALMWQLEDVAEQLGIGTFNKGWRPMDAQTLAALEQQLDGWAAKLAKLEAAGAPETARRELIEKIGRGQAELLATKPNMYMDVGNIKTLVTRRDIDLAKIERALQQTLGSLDQASLARLGTVFTHERYLKILGEGPHIDHALRAIRPGGSTRATAIASALKAFAKHSERVVATIGSDVAHGVNPRMWNRLHAEFRRILKAAKEGKLAGEVSANLSDLLVRVELQAAELQRGMTTAARALREQAALGKPLTAAESAGLSAWAASEAEARLQTEALILALRDYHLGVVTGRAGADFLDLLDEDPLSPDGSHRGAREADASR